MDCRRLIFPFILLSLFLVLCRLASAQSVPFGAAPPAGQKWVNTFDDEMNFFDLTKWSLNTAFTGTVTNSNGLEYLTSKVDYSNLADRLGRVAMDTTCNFGAQPVNCVKFSQKYGYFEWRAQLPHDNNGEGDGIWSALWFLPVGKFGYPLGCQEGNEEIDLAESIGSTHNSTYTNFSVHDFCYNDFTITIPTTLVGSLTAGMHVYGLYWRNDGSGPFGSVQGYIDGVPQFPTHVLDSNSLLWNKGIYMIMQVEPTTYNNSPWGEGSPTTVNTSSNDPLIIDYARAWKLSGGTLGPTPTPTPSY